MRGLDDGNWPWIACPVCGATSYHPMDVREGYCGNCHSFTSEQLVLDESASDELKKVVLKRIKDRR